MVGWLRKLVPLEESWPRAGEIQQCHQHTFNGCRLWSIATLCLYCVMLRNVEATLPKVGGGPWKYIQTSTLVTVNINKMQVVGSKLYKRVETGCNLSKRFMSRCGATAPPLALAEIATSLSSFAQFADHHLHFVDVYCNEGARLHVFGGHPLWEEFPPHGSSFLTPLPRTMVCW